MDPMSGLKRAKRIASHISFFKAGVCLGKTLVCVVKASPLSSTIKTLEPIDQNVRGRAKPTFRKLLQGGNDTLKVFKVSRRVEFSYGVIREGLIWVFSVLFCRSFISLFSRARFTSSRRSFVSDAQTGLRLSISRRWIRKVYLTRRMLRWNSCANERT